MPLCEKVASDIDYQVVNIGRERKSRKGHPRPSCERLPRAKKSQVTFQAKLGPGAASEKVARDIGLQRSPLDDTASEKVARGNAPQNLIGTSHQRKSRGRIRMQILLPNPPAKKSQRTSNRT